MKNKKIFAVYNLLFLAFPFFSKAQFQSGLPEETLAGKILDLALWPAGIIGIAGFVGFWVGLVMIVNPSKRSKGKKLILWSLLGVIIGVIVYYWHASRLLCCGNLF